MTTLAVVACGSDDSGDTGSDGGTASTPDGGSGSTGRPGQAGDGGSGSSADSDSGADAGTGAPADSGRDGADSGGDGGTDSSAPSALFITGQAASSISLAWTAPAASAHPVDHYKIYRNGSAYATSTAATYIDAAATHATSPDYDSASLIYAYAISAVDSAGTESAQTTDTRYTVYAGGKFAWGGDYSYGVQPIDYKDTKGAPESGPFDIAVTADGAGGGFQPFAGGNVPSWDFETGSLHYISIDLKPGQANQTSWRLSMISRLPPGDVYPWAQIDMTKYGPVPVMGKWGTYKVPLTALSIGSTSFTASISGTTLTVTSVASGVGVDAGGFISGKGVTPGTYITDYDHGQPGGGATTYTISPSQTVASTAMTEQRTACYKFDVIDQSMKTSNDYYVDNVYFSAK